MVQKVRLCFEELKNKQTFFIAIFVFLPLSWKNAKHLQNYTGWAQFWHKNLHNCFLSVFALKSSNCGGTYVWKSFYIVIIYGLSRSNLLYNSKTWNGKMLTSNKGKISYFDTSGNVCLLALTRENKVEWFGMRYLLGASPRL